MHFILEPGVEYLTYEVSSKDHLDGDITLEKDVATDDRSMASSETLDFDRADTGLKGVDEISEANDNPNHDKSKQPRECEAARARLSSSTMPIPTQLIHSNPSLPETDSITAFSSSSPLPEQAQSKSHVSPVLEDGVYKFADGSEIDVEDYDSMSSPCSENFSFQPDFPPIPDDANLDEQCKEAIEKIWRRHIRNVPGCGPPKEQK